MNAPHPGIILLDQHLKPAGLSQNRLANHISVPPRRINEIILGKRAITADTAVRLATCFGNDATYWMGLQAAYDIRQAEQKITDQLRKLVPLGETPEQPEDPPARPQRKIRRRIMR